MSKDETILNVRMDTEFIDRGFGKVLAFPAVSPYNKDKGVW